MNRPFLAAVLVLGVAEFGAPAATQIGHTPYEDAKPILEAMAEIIPAELRDAPAEHQREAWDAWAKKRDAEIRERLAQGDGDSVVNFLLFGASFTAAPRLTGEQRDTANWQTIYERRTHDLVAGMSKPGSNERLQFARKTLERAGVNFSEADADQKARGYLRDNVQRVIREQAGFQQALQAAKGLNNAVEEFAERSKLYKERGLSLDTSLPPDYALDVALHEMKGRGLLKIGEVKRVGIIGPGLDFTDKQEGFDFYPTQTIQPFAVMESLLRLHLAQNERLEIDALDLSPRVLEHVGRAKSAAGKGRGYTIQLLKDPARGWNDNVSEYWKHFGDYIGTPTVPAPAPAALKGLGVRAIRVKPEFVRRLNAFDVNIVLQRADLEEDKKFDLLIATNILVYYDTLEQSLAMTNIAAMLKPGGFLLTNNALLELPSSEMRSVGYKTVIYSTRADDGDHIVWYQRKSKPMVSDNTH